MTGFRRARLVAVLLLPCAAAADDESALYFLSRAKDAIAAGDLDRASEFLEKSAKEKEGYPPTLLAIADVANRRGEPDTAIRFLEACLAQRQRADLSASEREAMAAAEKMLAELDEARAEFRKLLGNHVADLVRLARATKDPALAKECWRTVLQLDPEHAEAREQMAGGARPEPRPDAARPAKAVPLFNGKDMDALTGGQPEWTVEEGILRGRVPGGGAVSRSERFVKGDFTVVCEMRTKEDFGDDPRFGILFGVKSTYDNFGFWVFEDGLLLERRFEETRSSDLQRIGMKRVSEKFNRSEWHTYRIRVEGKRIRCSIDDREVMEFSGPDRALDGYVALCVANQEAEIRSLLLELPK